MTAPPTNSPYATRSRRPYRIRPAARPTAAVSQAEHRQERLAPRYGLAAAALAQPSETLAQESRRPRRPSMAVRPLAAERYRCLQPLIGRAARRRHDHREHPPARCLGLCSGTAITAPFPSVRGAPGAFGFCPGSNTSDRRPGVDAGGGALPGPIGAVCAGGGGALLDPNCWNRYSVSSCIRLSCISSC